MAAAVSKLVRHRIRRWRELSSRERRTLLQAVLVLPMARAALRVLPLAAVRKMISRERARRSSLDAQQIRRRAAEVVRMTILAAERTPAGGTCLARALTACLLLSRAGIAADLRLGASRKQGEFEAHAWIECEGAKFDVSRQLETEYLPFDLPLNARRESR